MTLEGGVFFFELTKSPCTYRNFESFTCLVSEGSYFGAACPETGSLRPKLTIEIRQGD